jgi:thymidylate synthase ThyX
MTNIAKILADSITLEGARLTTFEVTIARMVLAEFNTHRMFSRNSASSRAIPVEKMIQMVKENPYIPESWGKNQKGMQAGEEVSAGQAVNATDCWIGARDSAIIFAERMRKAGIHKQITNRLLEPFMFHTIIVTATEWDNFWHLRDHEMAHPAIAKPAKAMRELYNNSTPQLVRPGGWHLPLVFDEDWDLERADMGITGEVQPREIGDTMVKISAGRCARISYLTHEGKRDLSKDVGLHDGLLGNGHMSPLEHPARPMTLVELETYKMYHYTLEDGMTFDSRTPFVGSVGTMKIVSERVTHFCGNFDGWIQHRKLIANEHDKMASL